MIELLFIFWCVYLLINRAPWQEFAFAFVICSVLQLILYFIVEATSKK